MLFFYFCPWQLPLSLLLLGQQPFPLLPRAFKVCPLRLQVRQPGRDGRQVRRRPLLLLGRGGLLPPLVAQQGLLFLPGVVVGKLGLQGMDLGFEPLDPGLLRLGLLPGLVPFR